MSLEAEEKLAMDRPGKLTELKDKSHQRLDKMVVCCVCVEGGRGRGRCGDVCVWGGGDGQTREAD